MSLAGEAEASNAGVASTMQQMSISFGVASASLAAPFFIPDRFQTGALEMIRGFTTRSSALA